MGSFFYTQYFFPLHTHRLTNAQLYKEMLAYLLHDLGTLLSCYLQLAVGDCNEEIRT